jgi:protein gp37
MTTIEWTERTWNVVTGCDRTSPGCDNCYAITLAKRLKAMGQAKYQRDGDPRTSGPGFGLTLHPDALDLPLHRRKPTTWFVNSMSDLFHKDVPDEFITRVWAVMAQASQHTFQVLTKRPQRAASFLADECECGHSPGVHLRSTMAWAGTPHSPTYVRGVDGHAVYHERSWPLPNVWLGTSIESDRYAFRADHLRSTPAAVRFLSLEPLLGPLPSLDLAGIDWVIAGGESGPNARPMHPDWVRDIRDRCVVAGVPFFFKQWGTWAPDGASFSLWPEDTVGTVLLSKDIGGSVRVATTDPRLATVATAIHEPHKATPLRKRGKKAAGRLLDGRMWDEMPERRGSAA